MAHLLPNRRHSIAGNTVFHWDVFDSPSTETFPSGATNGDKHRTVRWGESGGLYTSQGKLYMRKALRFIQGYPGRTVNFHNQPADAPGGYTQRGLDNTYGSGVSSLALDWFENQVITLPGGGSVSGLLLSLQAQERGAYAGSAHGNRKHWQILNNAGCVAARSSQSWLRIAMEAGLGLPAGGPFSTSPTGYVKVWLNGVLVVDAADVALHWLFQNSYTLWEGGYNSSGFGGNSCVIDHPPAQLGRSPAECVNDTPVLFDSWGGATITGTGFNSSTQIGTYDADLIETPTSWGLGSNPPPPGVIAVGWVPRATVVRGVYVSDPNRPHVGKVAAATVVNGIGQPGVAFSDNFNRANGSLGAAWTTPTLSASALTINTNQIAGTSSGASRARYLGALTGDVEASVVVPVKPANDGYVELWLFLNPHGEPADGYVMQWFTRAGTDDFRIQRLDNGVATTLGATVPVEYTAGDRLVFRRNGNDLEVLIDGGAVLATRTDSTYMSGEVALGLGTTSGRADDFIVSGEAVTAPPDPSLPVVHPPATAAGRGRATAGVVTLPGSPGTFKIKLPFAPKAMLFFGTNRPELDSLVTTGVVCGFRGIAVRHLDWANGGPAQEATAWVIPGFGGLQSGMASSAMHARADSAGTVDLDATILSWDSDGVTLTLNTAPASTRKVAWVAFDCNAAWVVDDVSDTPLAEYELGIDVRSVFMNCHGLPYTGSLDQTSNDESFGVAWAQGCFPEYDGSGSTEDAGMGIGTTAAEFGQEQRLTYFRGGSDTDPPTLSVVVRANNIFAGTNILSAGRKTTNGNLLVDTAFSTSDIGPAVFMALDLLSAPSHTNPSNTEGGEQLSTFDNDGTPQQWLEDYGVDDPELVLFITSRAGLDFDGTGTFGFGVATKDGFAACMMISGSHSAGAGTAGFDALYQSYDNGKSWISNITNVGVKYGHTEFDEVRGFKLVTDEAGVLGGSVAAAAFGPFRKGTHLLPLTGAGYG